MEDCQQPTCNTVDGLCLLRHVSVHNWTVNGCRLVQGCEGINWMYRDSWGHSAPNFMTELKNVQHCCQVGATLFQWDAALDMLWCHINLEWFRCEGDNKLNYIIAINETWARTYKPGSQMTVLQMVSYTLTTKMKGSTKSVCHNKTIQPWFKWCVVHLPPTSGMHSWSQLRQCSKHGWTENTNISSQSESLFCTAWMTQLHNWNLLLSNDLIIHSGKAVVWTCIKNRLHSWWWFLVFRRSQSTNNCK